MVNLSLNEMPERSIDFCEKYVFPLCDEKDRVNINIALQLAKEEGKWIAWRLVEKNLCHIKKGSENKYIQRNIEKTGNYLKAMCFKYKIFYMEFQRNV